MLHEAGECVFPAVLSVDADCLHDFFAGEEFDLDRFGFFADPLLLYRNGNFLFALIVGDSDSLCDVVLIFESDDRLIVLVRLFDGVLVLMAVSGVFFEFVKWGVRTKTWTSTMTRRRFAHVFL